MLGAIIGDICGAFYELTPVKTDDFELLGALDFSYDFTDETVLTVAIADAYMHKTSYAKALSDYTQAHPLRRYGKWFRHWATSVDLQPYNSYGNGSAMRVSAIGLLAQSEKEVLIEAKKSAEVTHSHPEGIKGAQAVALAIYLAKTGTKKLEIKRRIEEAFGYNLSRGLLEIRKTYRYDITCQGSVPEAIIAFLESTDFESAIKNAILLRGDADTQASIAGAIAQAYYQDIPQYLLTAAYQSLSDDLIAIVKEFQARHDALCPKKESSTEYQFKNQNITIVPFEEMTVERQRYYNSGGASMIPLNRHRPEPKVHFEPLSSALQCKYNGDNTSLAIIKHEHLRIYKSTIMLIGCITVQLLMEYDLADKVLQRRSGLYPIVSSSNCTKISLINLKRRFHGVIEQFFQEKIRF